MTLKSATPIDVPEAVLDSIRQFPVARKVEHCGERFAVDPFEIYATCPKCRVRIKLRSYSAGAEIEDIFDAVFAWMNQPGAEEAAKQRRRLLAEESEE